MTAVNTSKKEERGEDELQVLDHQWLEGCDEAAFHTTKQPFFWHSSFSACDESGLVAELIN